MATWIWILIVIIVGIAGAVGGFYAARKYMENYLKDNPPINEDQLRAMMLQMGQKPSQRKLHQMMNAMKQQSTPKK
ncbi:YneF family protein [Levilactobacillus huananensis]|uniref:YneF family protein n=1 Tax=Levilactobacillus huananensis TaxID=2486019 RepID=UPI000F782962|nr:YneF family protein [Levilactobacillus huananensis]